MSDKNAFGYGGKPDSAFNPSQDKVDSVNVALEQLVLAFQEDLIQSISVDSYDLVRWTKWLPFMVYRKAYEATYLDKLYD